MTIMPPDLMGGETKERNNKAQTQDRAEWYPSALVDGESATFRLMGNYSTGHAMLAYRWAQEVQGPDGLKFAGFAWQIEYPINPENAARLTDWSTPERRKIEDQFVKPKRCLAWLAYSVEQD